VHRERATTQFDLDTLSLSRCNERRSSILTGTKASAGSSQHGWSRRHRVAIVHQRIKGAIVRERRGHASSSGSRPLLLAAVGQAAYSGG
jgi:hypothetical protein